MRVGWMPWKGSWEFALLLCCGCGDDDADDDEGSLSSRLEQLNSIGVGGAQCNDGAGMAVMDFWEF